MSSAAVEALTQFHDFFGYDDPIIGHRLRLRLINEEHEELADELRADWTVGMDYDKRKVYKEAADLMYVLYGLDVHLGGYLDRAFEAVHQSNMTKLWVCDLCNGSGCGLIPYPDADKASCQCCSQCRGEGKIIKRREDGKVLKPPTYREPDLSFIE